jgi:GTP-binding protein EngB required for normal cell division
VTTVGFLDAALAGTDDPLRACLAGLLEAADAADALGLPTSSLRATYADAVARVGFPGEAYVLAFVGGTGVGKSSLLNTLAGSAVSAASARRPTTTAPIAWIPAAERAALTPLLAWIGVEDVREHAGTDLGPVAILDLPDMDSVAGEHRAQVEAILPRVDAVAWITDPEKYHDAALHDDFLRTWLPRLARQVVVLNKADRLSADDGQRVLHDLENDLASISTLGVGRGGAAVVPVVVTAASPGAGGPAVLDGLHDWLKDGVAAKAVVRARVAATVLDLARRVAADAGIDPRRPATRFLDDASRAAAIVAATAAVLNAVDLAGLQRQAEAATRARARARGTGPIGRVTSIIYRFSGREIRAADPDAYLMRWRERGSLAAAVESLRGSLATPLRAASPAVRPALARSLDPEPLRRGLERAVDRAMGGVGALEAPTSRWWSVIGFFQTLATVGLALAAAWVVLWIVARPRVDSAQLPIVGAVPMPFVVLVAFLAVGYLLARSLGLHAGHVGRRWAQDVRGRLTEAVASEVSQRGFAPLDELEDARARLWTAVATLERRCAEPPPG